MIKVSRSLLTLKIFLCLGSVSNFITN
uniref:Uncharacterized protein n=1 Tax=Rhizophora mucronata TaxID=61149 RepID=A0A2P2P6M2_RHIMU